LGVFLFVIGIVDVVLSKSVESYILILSFIPLGFALISDRLKNKELFKKIRMKAAYGALHFLFAFLLFLYLFMNIFNVEVNTIFWIFTVTLISYLGCIIFVARKTVDR
ncbi:hypothetical protein BTA31_18795, partial [Bacillus haynesii]